MKEHGLETMLSTMHEAWVVLEFGLIPREQSVSQKKGIKMPKRDNISEQV